MYDLELGLVLWKSPDRRLSALSDPHPAPLWPVTTVIVFLLLVIKKLILFLDFFLGIPTLELVNSPPEIDWSVSIYALIALLG